MEVDLFVKHLTPNYHRYLALKVYHSDLHKHAWGGVTPSRIETFGQDNVRIANKTYRFLEDSEDFQFNAPFKSENDQDFFEKLLQKIQKS